MPCSWWLLQLGHTPLPPFMWATKQSMQIIFLHKVSWIGRFRMFVQLGHWKSARGMLDAGVWNRDGYSGCTAWKLMGAMVLRCFQTVCMLLFPGWPRFFLSFLGLHHWLLNEHVTHVTAVSRVTLPNKRSDRAFIHGSLSFCVTNAACPLGAWWKNWASWIYLRIIVYAINTVHLPK